MVESIFACLNELLQDIDMVIDRHMNPLSNVVGSLLGLVNGAIIIPIGVFRNGFDVGCITLETVGVFNVLFVEPILADCGGFSVILLLVDAGVGFGRGVLHRKNSGCRRWEVLSLQ